MKEQLNYLLSRRPKVYESILRFRDKTNLEKLVFLNLVRNGDVVFDVGANRGYYTLLYSHLVGKKGQVHAFEPVPPTFDLLSSKIAACKRFDNVILNKAAVADMADTLPLYMPGEDDGQASLKKHSSGSWKNAEQVRAFECQAVRLDDYIAEKKIRRLDFIKCDVEGAELLVLRGVTQTLSKFTPSFF